ncbi:MAG: hypothetical protein GQ527_04870 [Bacteroidales bacterium]|nr:hypothetical protein [Bacteroidales bacterium]
MRKILNIFISLVFLISFIGIQINKHYSQGKLYSVAIYQDAESCCSNLGACEMSKKTNGPCEHQAKDDFSCNNTSELFKIWDVFVVENFSMPAIISLDLLINSFVQIVEVNSSSTILNLSNISFLLPPLETNFQVEFGSFLC